MAIGAKVVLVADVVEELQELSEETLMTPVLVIVGCALVTVEEKLLNWNLGVVYVLGRITVNGRVEVVEIFTSSSEIFPNVLGLVVSS